VSARAKSFQGGTFDGRYVYMAPASDSVLVRYDTTQAFSATTSWSTFDLGQLGLITTGNGYGNGWGGVAFDGEYVYFAPNQSAFVDNAVALRFKAKTPASLSAFTPSFF
jgi:hypothetical protein